MAIHDRPYMQEPPPYQDGPRMTMGGFPRPLGAVLALIIVNFTVFVVQAIVEGPHAQIVIRLSEVFGVTVASWWQVWRYVTFQFVHQGFWHIFMNMLGLYMLGTPLEQTMGPRRFVTFYLFCGVVAGVVYAVIGAAAGLDRYVPIVGASGGVYGVVLAVAWLMPQVRIWLMFIVVSARTAAAIAFGFMGLVVLSSLVNGNVLGAMSDVAHLGGALGAVGWLWGLPRLASSAADRRHVRKGPGAWQRKLQDEADIQAEIDRILKKVHDEGITSLTARERRTLREQTERQRREGM